MLSFEVGFVLDIAEAQSAGVETVLALVSRAGNHRAIQLRVFADRDIKAAFARKNTGLLLHRVIIAVQFVLTHAQVDRSAARDRDTDTAADAGLLRVIIIAVLLALQQQVAAHIHLHGFAARLSPHQRGITTTVQ
ncbi:Uncharacterised protein [Yersinia mollaretii]|nr:Uncharacterised protein [Yersinia mollaretii]